MEESLKSISEHPLLQIGGIFLGFLGIALAIVFYLRSKRVSKLRFESHGTSLVEGLSGALDGIEVRFNGTPQERISVTRFVFWNAGTETIRETDFTVDPLRILCSHEMNILDSRIVHAHNETNRIAIDHPASGQGEEKEVTIPVRFDYLDSGDGAVIQIVHDGRQHFGFSLAGTMKGNCSIARAESPAFRLERILAWFPLAAPMSKTTWFGWFGVLVYTAGGLAALVAPFMGQSWWFLLLAAFCLFGVWVMVQTAIGQVPKHLQRELGNLPTANNRMESNS